MNIACRGLLTGVFLLLTGFAGAAEMTPDGAPADWPEPILDSKPNSFVLFDQLEYRSNEGPNVLAWDAQAWFGGDYHRLWLETEGEDNTTGDGGEVERFSPLAISRSTNRRNVGLAASDLMR